MMYTKLPFRPRWSLWLAVIPAVIQLNPLHAQMDASTPANEEGVVYELSPFVVNSQQDRGYTATSSLAGGRLSSELRDTAAAVSVLTPQFLQDVGATNFLEAAKWTPNAVPSQEVNGAELYNDFGVQFRSLGAGFQSRNYFRWYINSDAYNTERIEFARGPNSLVFGDAGVGGVANVSSLQAQGTGASSIDAQWSSWGGYRATFDTDIRITDVFFVRAAGVYQRYDDWRDVGAVDRDGAFLTATYRPSKQTTVRAEAEWGQSDRLISFGILENYSGWNGVELIDAFIPAGTRLDSLRRNNSDRLVYDGAAPDLGIVNWLGYGATFGTFRMLTTEEQEGLPEDMFLDSYKTSFQAPNAGVDNPYYTVSAFFQHSFGNDLHLEIAANYQEQERQVTRWFFDALQVEVNTVLPNGDPNPHLGELFGEARLWDNDQKNEVLDVRASLAYIFNSNFSEQRVLLTTGHRDDRFENHQQEWVRTNGTDPKVTSAVNRIFIRRYASDLSIPVFEPPTIDPVSGIESRYARTSSTFSEKPITYLQGALVSKWFEKRNLNTLIGVRYDSYKEKINERASDVIDPVTREFLAFGKKVTSDSQDVTSFSGSAVYHLNQSFSLFAGYNESFDPGSTALAINGSSLAPLVSNGTEGGVKINLWKGRLVGTITYYVNEQENSRISGESNNINNIWNLLDQPDMQLISYSDRQTFEGSGFEFDFTAMPTENWRLLFNFALPDTELTDGLMDTRAYYNEHIDFWNSEVERLINEGETLTADAVANAINGIEDRIDSFEAGRRLNNTFKYTANIFTRYYFTDGALDGFSIGGGANFRGDRLVANQPGDPYDYVYAKDYVVFALVAGYERTIANIDWSLQLNVSNLFDDEIVRPTRYGTYRSGTENLFVPDRFTVQDPRRVLLTLTAKF